MCVMALAQTGKPTEPTELLQTSAVQVARWFGKSAAKKDFKILRYPGRAEYHVYGAGLTVRLAPDGTLKSATDHERRDARTKSPTRGGVSLSEATIKSVALRLAKVAYPKSTFTVVDWYKEGDDFRPQTGQRSWESGCAKVRFLMDERNGRAHVLVITFEMDTRELAGIMRSGPVATAGWHPKGTTRKGGG